MSPLNIVTLVFVVPFVVVLALLGVSHDIARKAERGGPVVLWKAETACGLDDWLCELTEQKG